MDSRRRYCGLGAAVLLASVLAGGPAAAQVGGKSDSAKQAPVPETDAPQHVPSLGLSESQQQTIFQSISNRQAKKDTAPPGFRVAVGARVPDSIELEPLPKTVVELVPKTAEYQYAFVANQVLIVDPRSRTVVEVIH